MNATNEISKIIQPILSQFGFVEIPQNLKDCVVFSSEKLTIRFVSNSFEGTLYYFLKHNTIDFEFENYSIEKYLGIKMKPVFSSGLENRSKDWLEFVGGYFEQDPEGLISGNAEFFKRMYNSLIEDSESYTSRFSKGN